MSARILSPDRLAERRPAQEPTLVEALLDRAGGVFSWQGASGQRYAHSIFSLIECPPLPKVAYALVRRDATGARHVLHIASGTSEAPTLNLARIRQRGATLGANEVHVHALARTDDERHLVVCDLRAGQFGALAEEPARAVCA
jgi:hypothetical protein